MNETTVVIANTVSLWKKLLEGVITLTVHEALMSVRMKYSNNKRILLVHKGEERNHSIILKHFEQLNVYLNVVLYPTL